MFALIFNLGIPLLLLIMGYFIGSHLEKKHYRDIIRREKQFTHVVVTSSKYAPDDATDANLVYGSVVVGTDYFKRLVSWLVGIFGGRIGVYESLLDRARREAVLRLKADAFDQGANLVLNLKFETATLSNIEMKQSAMVEVFVYGTAVKTP